MFTEKFSKLFNCRGKVSFYRLEPSFKCLSGTNLNTNFHQQILENDKFFFNKTTSEKIHRKRGKHKAIAVESHYARKIFESSKDYSKTLAKSLKSKDILCEDEIKQILHKQWISMNNSDLIGNLKLLSRFESDHNVNNLEYVGIFEVLANRCSSFSDDELHEFLKCLESWIPQKEDLIKIYFEKTIDHECMKRFSEWSIDEILLTNDQILKLNLIKSKFIKHSLHKISKKFNQFTCANLVHFAYLLKLSRGTNVDFNNLEYFLEKVIDKLSIDEIGIISLTFFRYETSIKRKSLLFKIIHKLEENIENVHNISLAAILKMLRYMLN